MRLDTALGVLSDAYLELSLNSAVPTDFYTSTDRHAVLLRAYLKALGRDLVRDYDWSQLQKAHTFDTVPGTASYALPTDFSRLLHSTEWNRSSAIPLGGPVHAQGWQLLKSSTTVSPVNYFYRVFGNRLHLHPTPEAVETIAFEYQSAWWVQPDGQSAPTAETPSAQTDTLWFDGHLLSRGLKARFLVGKGFDASAALNDYDKALSVAMGGDGAHAVLSLVPGDKGHPTPRLPETRWGV